jgi:hypothetical protein
MKLSQKLSDFNSEINISVPYLTTAGNVTRLKIDSQIVTDAGDFKTDWNLKYGLYADPATHTDQTVIDINNAYRVFHPFMENVKKSLKSNPAITLIGADYTNIHIHIDAAHRVRVPRPEFAPTNQVIKSTHLVNRIFTSNPQPGTETSTHLPADVVKIGRKVAVVFPTSMPPGGGPAGIIAPSGDLYDDIEAIGHTQYDVVFQPEQYGATAFIITWYLNARGEAGPPSEPYSFKVI